MLGVTTCGYNVLFCHCWCYNQQGWLWISVHLFKEHLGVSWKHQRLSQHSLNQSCGSKPCSFHLPALWDGKTFCSRCKHLSLPVSSYCPALRICLWVLEGHTPSTCSFFVTRGDYLLLPWHPISPSTFQCVKSIFHQCSSAAEAVTHHLLVQECLQS